MVEYHSSSNDPLLHDRRGRGRHHLVHRHRRDSRSTKPCWWRRHKTRWRSIVHTHRLGLNSHRRHAHSRWHQTLRRTESWGWWRRSSQGTRKLPLIRSLEGHGRSGRAKNICWSRRRPSAYGQRVVLPCLSGEQPLCVGSVSFSLSIFLERVLDCDGLVHEELAVHGFDGRVRGFEIRVCDETISFRKT